MNRDQLFWKLMEILQITSPYPHEPEYMYEYLPTGGKLDLKGNYYYEINPDKSSTLFCAHLDTIGRDPMYTNPIIQGHLIVSRDKNAACLGGDDRCGVLCLLALIDAKVPGTYIFHIGEERGGIGAGYVKDNFDLKRFKRAVEFDRRGTTSIITRMGGNNCCSNEFAKALCDHLGMGFRPDDGGLYTDVSDYKYIIPEVTNFSVGYHQSHTSNENIEWSWLIDKFIPKILSLKWEDLPVTRDLIKEKEENDRRYDWRKNSNYGGNGSYGSYGNFNSTPGSTSRSIDHGDVRHYWWGDDTDEFDFVKRTGGTSTERKHTNEDDAIDAEEYLLKRYGPSALPEKVGAPAGDNFKRGDSEKKGGITSQNSKTERSWMWAGWDENESSGSSTSQEPTSAQKTSRTYSILDESSFLLENVCNICYEEDDSLTKIDLPMDDNDDMMWLEQQFTRDKVDFFFMNKGKVECCSQCAYIIGREIEEYKKLKIGKASGFVKSKSDSSLS